MKENLPSDYEKEYKAKLELLGGNIKKARIDKRWSALELARRMSVSKKTVSAWEVGRNELGWITLARLATVLEKPIAYFLEPPVFVKGDAIERESGIPPGTTKKVTRAKRKAA